MRLLKIHRLSIELEHDAKPAHVDVAPAKAPEPPRATLPAVEETLTIALGAEERNNPSSASVSRTCASKLIAIVRRTFS